MPRISLNVVAQARRRARALRHVAWRDDTIAELESRTKRDAERLLRIGREISAIDSAIKQVPSMHRYIHAERRIVRHLQDLGRGDRGHLTTRKLTSYSFAQSHGLAIPKIFGVWDTPQDIPWGELPDEVVIKSNRGTASRGVFPIRRVPGGWTVVTSTAVITPEEIVARLDSLARDNKVGGPYFAEELHSGTSANALPVDIKVMCFYGEVGHFLLRTAPEHGKGDSLLFRIIYPDGTDPGPILTGVNHSADISVPDNLDEIIEVAARVSRHVPLAFIRIDMYRADGRLVFGEFTPRPGNPMDYGPEHDERLGHLWERAQARVLNDAIDGGGLALKYGPGPRELAIGTGGYLP